MIRVLQSVSNMDRAGIETMLMNYYRHMDHSLIRFDFLANKPAPGAYDEEIRAMGDRVLVSPGLSPTRYGAYRRFMADLIRNTPEIKIVHGHNEAMAYYALKTAEDAGVGVRIAHAHNTRIIKDYKYPLKMVCKKLLPKAATDYWACGTDAGLYYFGKKRWEEKGRLIRNAIDLKRFRFDPDLRERMRQKHGLTDCYVIGHVGRFNIQKNHERLIRIFAELLPERPEARLILIGVGELEEMIKRKTAEAGLGDKVLFIGQTADVNEWYQAMDCFVMPSLFEGLPVVGIEAQASGLPCIFSERITTEAVIAENVKRLALESPDSLWVKEILELPAKTDRTRGESAARAAGYDIEEAARTLQDTYLTMAERIR